MGSGYVVVYYPNTMRIKNSNKRKQSINNKSLIRYISMLSGIRMMISSYLISTSHAHPNHRPVSLWISKIKLITAFIMDNRVGLLSIINKDKIYIIIALSIKNLVLLRLTYQLKRHSQLIIFLIIQAINPWRWVLKDYKTASKQQNVI